MAIKRKIQLENTMNEEVENMDKNIQETTIQAQETATEVQVPEVTTTESATDIATEDETNATEIVMNAIPFSAKNVTRALATSGGFSIVKARTGNRITLSKQGYEYLGKPNTMKFSFNDTSLIIGGKLPNNNNAFNVKDSNGKAIVYSIPLVTEIAKAFELDFSNRTSMTFGDIQHTKNEDSPIIIVKIK